MDARGLAVAVKLHSNNSLESESLQIGLYVHQVVDGAEPCEREMQQQGHNAVLKRRYYAERERANQQEQIPQKCNSSNLDGAGNAQKLRKKEAAGSADNGTLHAIHRRMTVNQQRRQ